MIEGMKASFCDIMKGSKNVEVDKLCCILFVSLYNTVRPGALGMTYIFTGRPRDRMRSAPAVILCEADAPLLF